MTGLVVLSLKLNSKVANGDQSLSVYTTRPDTVYGVTHMGLAAQHPLAREAAKSNPKLADFIEQCKNGRNR